MKVLSLKEPFATLIKDKVKFIETRSWKTKYRGELYIHASLSKVSKNQLRNPEILNFVKSNYNYGFIICKVKLVDCIEMTEDFIKEIKKNNIEYLCGEYSIGRYAWILDDIEVLDRPIKVKGHLGIWNYEGD